MDYYELAARSSFQDSLKVLEADIHYANFLAASIPTGKGGAGLHMKVVYNHLAPIFLFLLKWMDCSCTCLLASFLNLFHVVVYKVSSDGKPDISSYGRKATIKEFYKMDIAQESHSLERVVKKKLQDKWKVSDSDLEREDECGICLEPCTKMVLPNCCHAMCINCYHEWNSRSESCPFCRGSLKRVNSGDLWVLTSTSDVVETRTVLKEDMLRFYLYINKLPKDIPDALFLMYYEYLI